MNHAFAQLWQPPTHPGLYGRLSASCKLALGMLLALWVILVDARLLLAIPAVVLILLALIEPLNVTQRKLMWGALALLVWATVISQGLFYQRIPREALVTFIAPGDFLGLPIEGLRIYREGLLYGLTQSLRLAVMLLIGLLTAYTTPLHALLGGLEAMRVPRALGFLAITAARSLPVIAGEALGVAQALRLRHLTWRQVGLQGVLRPLLASALRRSRTLAWSLEMRGIDPTNPRLGTPDPLSLGERLMLAVVGLAVLTAAALRLLWVLYQRGWWYEPDWLTVYVWATRVIGG